MSKVKQIKDWLEEQFDSAHLTIIQAGQGNESISSETIIQNISKMNFITSAQDFIDGLEGDDE